MNDKKIILTDTVIPRKKAKKQKIIHVDGYPRNSSGGINPRQKSEAVGLLLIGLSAFSLTLLYYLATSKVTTQVSWLIVHFGIGVYIIPVLMGIMGIQRFFERPVGNHSLRFLGTMGALCFGLGFLGTEGGKFGGSIFQLFSGKFGALPSQALFACFTLASLIFALDILYKDLLMFLALALSILFKVSQKTYEVTLALLAMFIGVVRATTEFFPTVFRSLQATFFPPQDPDWAFQETGRLIPFQGTPSVLPSDTKTERSSDQSSQEETVIPAPQNWRDVMNNGVSPTPSVQTAADQSPHPVPLFAPQFISVPIETIAPQITVVNLSPMKSIEPVPLSPSKTSPKPAAVDRLPTRSATITETGTEQSESSLADSDQSSAEDLDDDEELEVECTLEDSSVPESLDDHPIDKDLEKGMGDSRIEPKALEKVAALPPFDLLTTPPIRETNQTSDLEERSELLLKTLDDFGIKAIITAVVQGPAVSRFELKPAPGVKVSRITTLTDDIALALAAPAIRIEAPIPGKPALGIEIPNPNPTPVFFYDLVHNEKFKTSETPLNLALGVTISGRPVFADLTEMPHLLIAGSTGSGKSVCINTIIASILFLARADQVKLIMIDPKMVELSSYNGIPHLISPVVTDPKKASGALLWAVEEMERRYELLAACGMRKITTYNEELPRLRQTFDPELEHMPFLVIIIDELADLMMTASAQVEGSICRLAQMARAVGIHLIIATQRPSVDVITGIIKANLPSRIAFSVASHIDSRTILDAKGAEKLLGKGDMLFVPKGRNKPLRLQGAYISDRELANLTDWVRSQGQPEYIEIAPDQSDEEGTATASEADDGDDDQRLLNEIETYVLTQEKTSTSMLQRKFKIGYNRAARIMDLLEERGIVSPQDGSNKRRVIGRRSSSQS